MGILPRGRGGRGASSSGGPLARRGERDVRVAGRQLHPRCAHLCSPRGAHRRGDGGVKMVLSHGGILRRSEKAKSSTPSDVDEP